MALKICIYRVAPSVVLFFLNFTMHAFNQHAWFSRLRHQHVAKSQQVHPDLIYLLQTERAWWSLLSLLLKPKMNSLLKELMMLASLETWCDTIGLILIYLHIFVVVVVTFTRQLVYIYAHIYGPDAVTGGAMTGNPLSPFTKINYSRGKPRWRHRHAERSEGMVWYKKSFKSHQYIEKMWDAFVNQPCQGGTTRPFQQHRRASTCL